MEDGYLCDNEDIETLKSRSPQKSISGDGDEEEEETEEEEVKQCEKDEDDIGFKTFYTLYRFKQRISGLVWGMTEGYFSGTILMGKWGGGGGIFFGALTQVLSVVWGSVSGVTSFGLLGFLSDRHVVAKTVRHYRYSIGSGGYNSIRRN